MPAAIDLAARAAIAPQTGRRVVIRSAQYEDAAVFDLDAADPPIMPSHWSSDLRGVARLLQRAGVELEGCEIMLDSEVPIGAGLSSSAAVAVAVAFGLLASSSASLGLTELALLCQRASHEFSGTRCGIMDFYIACHGRPGELAMLDTRSLEARWLPWPRNASLVVCDTKVRHDNASGEYNLRREQCERAARQLGVPSLRDAGAGDISRLEPVLAARARHVVSENQRVVDAAAAVTESDFAALGELLNASHRSLRDDYEVSCAELDRMVEVCNRQLGVYGARMMGGGFGGCVLALVAPECVPDVRGGVARDYAEATGLQPAIWECHPAGGVREMEENDVAR